MRDDQLAMLLRTVDGPLHADPAFADALFLRLMTEVQPAAQLPLPHRRWRARWTLAPVAASVVLLLLVVLGFVMTDKAAPRSAFAVMTEARSRFASVPPFSATVVRQTPPADMASLPAEMDTTKLPLLLVEREVEFRDAQHWRTTVVGNTYSAQPGVLRAIAPYDVGDFAVSDGEMLGQYSSRSQRLLVAPVGERDLGDLLSLATAEIAPRPEQTFPFLDDVDLERRCVVSEGTEVAGRAATTIRCASYGLSLDVDVETGLLLRLEKSTGDRGGRLAQPHRIEVRDLVLGAQIDDRRLVVTPPPGARAQWVGKGTPPEQYRVAPGGQVASTIQVGRVTTAAFAAPEGVFVLANDEPIEPGEPPPQRLVRIDPETSSITWSVDVDRYARSVAVHDGVVFVAGSRIVSHGTETTPQRNESFVERRDSATGRVLGRRLVVPGSADTAQVLFDGAGRVWFTGGPVTHRRTGGVTEELGSLVEVAPAGDSVLRRVRLPGRPVIARAANGALWVTTSVFDPGSRSDRVDVVRVDPARAAVASQLRTSVQVFDLVVTAGSAWVSSMDPSTGAGLVQRIDLRTGTPVTPLRIGRQPTGFTAAGGFLWLLDSEDALLRRLDPATGKVEATLRVGDSPTGLASGDDTLWITDVRNGTVKRTLLPRGAGNSGARTTNR